MEYRLFSVTLNLPAAQAGKSAYRCEAIGMGIEGFVVR